MVCSNLMIALRTFLRLDPIARLTSSTVNSSTNVATKDRIRLPIVFSFAFSCRRVIRARSSLLRGLFCCCKGRFVCGRPVSFGYFFVHNVCSSISHCNGLWQQLVQFIRYLGKVRRKMGKLGKLVTGYMDIKYGSDSITHR